MSNEYYKDYPPDTDKLLLALINHLGLTVSEDDGGGYTLYKEGSSSVDEIRDFLIEARDVIFLLKASLDCSTDGEFDNVLERADDFLERMEDI